MPVGTSGRRLSYSESVSNFQTMASAGGQQVFMQRLFQAKLLAEGLAHTWSIAGGRQASRWHSTRASSSPSRTLRTLRTR